MGSVLGWLRPHPHRGDVIAAGAVPLALAALVIELRMTQWPIGGRLIVGGSVASLILAMGWLAPLEADGPRPYHSILLIGGLLSAIPALALLAELLGASSPLGAGGLCWVFAVEAALAGATARRMNSAACTLVTALASVVALEAFVRWAFTPSGLGPFRLVLLVLSLAFVVGSVELRDHRRRHAVALIDAAGLAALLLALTFVGPLTIAGALSDLGAGVGRIQGAPSAGFGWELYLLGAGFGLLAYAGVDREPGPAYLGVAVLAAFAVLVGKSGANGGSLLGWPLFLLLIGVAGLVIGLRPRRPLPPPPEPEVEAATIPLRQPDP